MRRSLTVLLVAGTVLAGACGGGDDDKESSSSTTARPGDPTSTLPAPAAGVAPLTGLPLTDAGKGNRPALVVKIDNAPKARPQIGLNQADVVVEEKVEDGVVRLFTIFHTGESDPVGPVRSARTTDISLAAPLNRPLFAYSGTNDNFQRLVSAAPLIDLGPGAFPGGYFRQPGRPAPYNLFSRTSTLWTRAPAGAGPPPPLFRFRSGDAAASGEGSGGVNISYVGKNITTVVAYTWDAGAGTWPRVQNGTPHTDAAGVQVAPKNVIVQLVEYVNTGEIDRSGAAVPEADLVGEGEAWIFTAGKVVKGKWSRANAEALTAYTGPDGTPVLLTPGQTWVELAPLGSASLR